MVRFLSLKVIQKMAKWMKKQYYYQHINRHRQVRIGKCHSIPHIMENGKIALQEKWQWLNGDLSCGESVVVEQ